MKRLAVGMLLAACGADQRAAAPPPAPNKPIEPMATAPTREQCDRLLGHLIELEFARSGQDPAASQSVFDSKRDEFRAACGKIQRARVECALAGRDLDAVAKCDDAH